MQNFYFLCIFFCCWGKFMSFEILGEENTGKSKLENTAKEPISAMEKYQQFLHVNDGGGWQKNVKGNYQPFLHVDDGGGLQENVKMGQDLDEKRQFREIWSERHGNENENPYMDSGRESLILQERHLRYLMSSTAEQPDNSGRSSSFNIWLTILIAALAAAILS